MSRHVAGDVMNLPIVFNARMTELGMSKAALAARSKVSLATVNRIISGKVDSVSMANVEAIAIALGLELVTKESVSGEELKQRQARSKAKKLVALVQGTSALEGQGLSQRELDKMVRRTSVELLSSKRKLWGQ